MSWCRRAAPSLLIHNGLFLVVSAGILLTLSARLAWDPITYVPLHQLVPQETKLAATALCALGMALLALSHLAIQAVFCGGRWKLVLLYFYAGAMLAIVACEIFWVCWTYKAVIAWLDSDESLALREALALREHIKPILDYIERYHATSPRLKQIIKDAEDDLPRNFYALGSIIGIMVIAQCFSIVMAILAAGNDDNEELDEEQQPLNTVVYKNGRLVMM